MDREVPGRAAGEAAAKAFSSCTNAAPGVMGAHAAPPYLLLLAPPGTTWSLAGGSPERGGRSRDVYPVVGVQSVAPPAPERLRQELMAAPPSSRLGRH